MSHLRIVHSEPGGPQAPRDAFREKPGDAWHWLQELELIARRIKDPACLPTAAQIFHKRTAYMREDRGIYYDKPTPSMRALTPETVCQLMVAYQRGDDAFIFETASMLAGRRVKVRGLVDAAIDQLTGSICGIWKEIREAIDPDVKACATEKAARKANERESRDIRRAVETLRKYLNGDTFGETWRMLDSELRMVAEYAKDPALWRKVQARDERAAEVISARQDREGCNG
jgi:hypothetical protein